jgi:hypothetical protein
MGMGTRGEGMAVWVSIDIWAILVRRVAHGTTAWGGVVAGGFWSEQRAKLAVEKTVVELHMYYARLRLFLS